MKTVQEQLADLRATHAQIYGQMQAIAETAANDDEGRGRSMTAEEGKNFDTFQAQIKQLDTDIARLSAFESIKASTAKPVTQEQGESPVKAAAARSPKIEIVAMKRDKGLDWARYVGCMAKAKGSISDALHFAKSRFRDDAMLHKVIELHNNMSGAEIIKAAAVDVGTTTDSDFASPLVYYTNMANEFIDFLRPQTIVGRIPGLRRVPFDIRVARQTSGGTASWVGEGNAKPLTQQAFDAITLGHTKLACITVITQELARFSSPSAETIIRNDLANSVIEAMDADFVDPDNAGTANIKPASITNGVTPAVSNGGTTEANIRADVNTLFAEWITNNKRVVGGVWIMPTVVAMRLANVVNSLGQQAFPGVQADGGTFFGLPVVTSQSSGLLNSSANGKVVILANAPEILLADDGQVTIDISDQASVQMDSAPDNPTTASTVMVSLWQRNLLGVKAERFINWTKARSTSVSWANSVNWGE